MMDDNSHISVKCALHPNKTPLGKAHVVHHFINKGGVKRLVHRYRDGIRKSMNIRESGVRDGYVYTCERKSGCRACVFVYMPTPKHVGVKPRIIFLEHRHICTARFYVRHLKSMGNAMHVVHRTMPDILRIKTDVPVPHKHPPVRRKPLQFHHTYNSTQYLVQVLADERDQKTKFSVHHYIQIGGNETYSIGKEKYDHVNVWECGAEGCWAQVVQVNMQEGGGFGYMYLCVGGETAHTCCCGAPYRNLMEIPTY